MLILAKPQEIFSADFPGQSEPFCSQPNPFARHPLSFVVVIPNRKVFREIKVSVNNLPNVKVRARTGYYPANP